MTHFSPNDVARILPHRFPFLFVDQVAEFVPGQRIVAIKSFSIDDRVACGNPPGLAIIPTSVILELVTQVGAVLVMERPEMAGKIAMILHIAVPTVDTHRRQIMDKLQLRTIAELTKYAIREGLTSAER